MVFKQPKIKIQGFKNFKWNWLWTEFDIWSSNPMQVSV